MTVSLSIFVQDAFSFSIDVAGSDLAALAEEEALQEGIPGHRALVDAASAARERGALLLVGLFGGPG